MKTRPLLSLVAVLLAVPSPCARRTSARVPRPRLPTPPRPCRTSASSSTRTKATSRRRSSPRKAPITVANFLNLAQQQFLRRPEVSPGHRRFHDPGRRPAGHRAAAARATSSRTNPTARCISTSRAFSRWPTAARTPTAASSSSRTGRCRLNDGGRNGPLHDLRPGDQGAGRGQPDPAGRPHQAHRHPRFHAPLFDGAGQAHRAVEHALLAKDKAKEVRLPVTCIRPPMNNDPSARRIQVFADPAALARAAAEELTRRIIAAVRAAAARAGGALGRFDAEGALRAAGRRAGLPRASAVGAHAFLLRRRAPRRRPTTRTATTAWPRRRCSTSSRACCRRRTSTASTARNPTPRRPPPITPRTSAAVCGDGRAALRRDPARAWGRRGTRRRCFPARRACARRRRWPPRSSRKWRPTGITFTPPLLRNAAALLFLVAGKDKADMLATVLEGDRPSRTATRRRASARRRRDALAAGQGGGGEAAAGVSGQVPGGAGQSENSGGEHNA